MMTAFLLFCYVTLGAIYSPEFLLSDIKTKFQALAADTITITAKVLGPPVKPIVSASAICDNGNLFVNISWPADENTKNFSIERNANPLVSGLLNNNFLDSGVQAGKTYTYMVTAHGDMGPGFANSDLVAVNTPAECSLVLPTPKVSVTDFDFKGLRAGDDGLPETENKRPFFSGNTNIPNAKISLMVESSNIIYANLDANLNGYWSWQPSQELSYGQHVLTVEAVDPLDLNRKASTQFKFLIEKEEGSGDSNSSKKKTSVVNVIKQLPPIEIKKPLDFSLNLEKTDIVQGDYIQSSLHVDKLDKSFDNSNATVKYFIYDREGNVVSNLFREIALKQGETLNEKMLIPLKLKEGGYSFNVEIIFDKYDISLQKGIRILGKPAINLGGGYVLTYPDLLSKIGYIAVWLFALLLIWILFFFREYWLYLHAIRHITERNLSKLGFFGAKRV